MLAKLVFPSTRAPEGYEVCRFTIQTKNRRSKLDLLSEKVREITGLKKNVEFKFYRKKQGSFEQICTEEDLNELIIDEVQTDCARIYAVPVLGSYVKRLNSFFDYCRIEELPNIISPRNTELEAKIKDPWLTTPCHLCEREDWSGERYTCLYCPNIVMCPQCFYTGYHPDHPILITRDAKSFSRKLLQLARVVTASVPWEHPHPKITIKNPGNAPLSEQRNQ
ncbi:unnamed protein product [Calicophoron daubneyi]|uniref:ZZ-type domain-containing protein n=1 Tax=Calicophoron daubneyi TaxID=300641 RepID=A0AAV2TZY4_CALDB